MKKDERLTEFLKEKLMETGLTVQGICARTGLSYPSVRKILNGETKAISPKTAHAIIAALGIEMSEIEKVV